MNSVSLDHLTVLDASPRQLIEAAVAGGFDAVGLRIVPPQKSDTVVEVVGKPELKREIKSLLGQTGIRIGLIEAIWLAPDTDIAALEPALATGAELGARSVLACGNDDDEGRLADNLGGLASAARRYDLTIVFEFMSYVGVRTLADAIRLKQTVDQPNVRLLIDALHLARSGVHPRTLGRLDSSLVGYVHLCDAAAEAPPPDKLREEGRFGRFYPGEGALPLFDFLDAMPEDVPIGVEAPCRQYAHLPPVERGRRVGQATRSLLERHDARRQAAAPQEASSR
jgi:sugar phosphate isomerase/epimerase